MPTEDVSSRFADLDLWPTQEIVQSMAEGQLAAAAAVQSQVEPIARAVEDAAARLEDPSGRLIYVGAGTSGRIAMMDGVELNPTFGWGSDRVAFLLAGGPAALLSSIEGAEDDAAGGEREMRGLAPTSRDVVVGVAASGRTPYTLAAVCTAHAAGALTVGLASNSGTPLLQSVAHPIFLDTGAEIVAGSTRMKAATAQKIALNSFSTAVMVRLGRVHAGMMISMRPTNAKLRGRALQMVCALAHVDRSVAEEALAVAGEDIKLAVLIALGQSRERGVASLQASGGNLRAALDRTNSAGE